MNRLEVQWENCIHCSYVFKWSKIVCLDCVNELYEKKSIEYIEEKLHPITKHMQEWYRDNDWTFIDWEDFWTAHWEELEEQLK
jgi:hypothetical protein